MTMSQSTVAVEPKKLVFFGNGKPMDDYYINKWINECLDHFKSGKTHMCISSGDTLVAMFKWETEVQILVCTNQGRSMMSFPLEGPFEFVPYIRERYEQVQQQSGD